MLFISQNFYSDKKIKKIHSAQTGEIVSFLHLINTCVCGGQQGNGRKYRKETRDKREEERRIREINGKRADEWEG